MKQSTVKAPQTIAALIMAVLASALLAACPAYATGNYSFKRIDNTFGLSSSNVKCVAEDSYGFIWLGTKNGLHRYDGLDMRRLNCFDHKRNRATTTLRPCMKTNAR